MMSSIDEAKPSTPPAADQEGEAAPPPTTPPPLAPRNWLNLVAYVVNLVLVYGVGTAGWLGADNATLSAKYQTLVTPNSRAFSIWAVIFLFQGAFAVLHMLPRFRAHPAVVEGVGLWYLAVVAAQVGWTFAFATEVIPLSLAFMLLILASLLAILYRQYNAASDGTLVEFWILRFPFAIHAGWIAAASALNLNVTVVAAGNGAAAQLATAIVSLAALHAASVWATFHLSRPNWTIAGVLAWACGWIYAELGDPRESISNTFSEETVEGVRYAALAVAIVIVVQVAFRLGLLLVPSWNPCGRAGEAGGVAPSPHSNEADAKV